MTSTRGATGFVDTAGSLNRRRAEGQSRAIRLLLTPIGKIDDDRSGQVPRTTLQPS
jgi:hypothetical protein